MFSKCCTTLICLFVYCGVAMSAPFPATSTSTFIGLEKGLFTSPEGFRISAENTDWQLSEAPENPHIITIFKAPYLSDGTQPSLTVRVDQLHEKTNINDYMKKWLKEYPRLGFEVLSSRKLEINKQDGVLIDLLSPKNQKQLRQAIFINGKKDRVVILTCRDNKKGFEKSLSDCNQLIKNFAWTQAPLESEIKKKVF